jgi:hypothetical protein
MVKKGVSGKFAFCLAVSALFIFSFKTAFSAQSSPNSCLDCHTSVANLKKITLELEKSKPKKSSETAGEG